MTTVLTALSLLLSAFSGVLLLVSWHYTKQVTHYLAHMPYSTPPKYEKWCEFCVGGPPEGWVNKLLVR